MTRQTCLAGQTLPERDVVVHLDRFWRCYALSRVRPIVPGVFKGEVAFLGIPEVRSDVVGCIPGLYVDDFSHGGDDGMEARDLMNSSRR